MICGRHITNDFSARLKDLINFRGILTLFCNEFEMAEIETLWLSCIEIWDVHFTSVLYIMALYIMAGWIAEMLLCNGLNKPEYEVYWLI